MIINLAGNPTITISESLPYGTSPYVCNIIAGMLVQPYTRWVDVTKKTVPYYCMENLNETDKPVCITPIEAICVEEYEH